jgi:hypothetical protein
LLSGTGPTSAGENPLRLRADSPCRPVDWRWRRAKWLADEGAAWRKRETDPLVKDLCKFLHRWNHSRGLGGKLGLQDRLPGMTLVCDLVLSNDYVLPHRCELEARLLTEASYEEIAETMLLKPEDVELYEQLVFNVRDRLRSRSYVVNYAIGSHLHTGIGDFEYGLIWKVFAYGGGPLVLEALLMGWTAEARVDRPDHVVTYFGDQSRSAMERKNCVNMLTMQTTNVHSKLHLGELRAKYAEVEQKLKAQGGQTDGSLLNLKELLASLNWRVGSQSAAESRSELVRVFDNSPVEPRAASITRLALGHVDEQLLRSADLRFPEKKLGGQPERPVLEAPKPEVPPDAPMKFDESRPVEVSPAPAEEQYVEPTPEPIQEEPVRRRKGASR